MNSEAAISRSEFDALFAQVEQLRADLSRHPSRAAEPAASPSDAEDASIVQLKSEWRLLKWLFGFAFTVLFAVLGVLYSELGSLRDAMTRGFELHEARLDSLDRRLTVVEEGQKHIVELLQRMEARMDEMDARFDRLETRLGRLESDVGEIKTLLTTRREDGA